MEKAVCFHWLSACRSSRLLTGLHMTAEKRKHPTSKERCAFLTCRECCYIRDVETRYWRAAGHPGSLSFWVDNVFPLALVKGQRTWLDGSSSVLG